MMLNMSELKTSTLSLPPEVEGLSKGELLLAVHTLKWDLAGSPTNVQLRVRWWGAKERDDAVLLLEDGGIRFAVKCGPRHFSQYLKDMSSIELQIEDRLKKRHVGTVTIDVRTLDVNKDVEGSFPILAIGNGRCLGKLEVLLHVHFGNITSFEMAEHQACTDETLPMFPAQRPQQVTQLTPSKGTGTDSTRDKIEIDTLLGEMEANSGTPKEQEQPNADHERFDFFLLLSQAFKRCANDAHMCT